MPIPFPLVASLAVNLVDIILKRAAKNPAEAPQLAGVVAPMIEVLSQAAEETPDQTAKRLANHDALVAQYAAAPPPGVNL